MIARSASSFRGQAPGQVQSGGSSRGIGHHDDPGLSILQLLDGLVERQRIAIGDTARFADISGRPMHPHRSDQLEDDDGAKHGGKDGLPVGRQAVPGQYREADGRAGLRQKADPQGSGLPGL